MNSTPLNEPRTWKMRIMRFPIYSTNFIKARSGNGTSKSISVLSSQLSYLALKNDLIGFIV